MESKAEFDEKITRKLKALGYTIFAEEERARTTTCELGYFHGKTRAKPDFICCSDDYILLLETKSPMEYIQHTWLWHGGVDRFPDFREKCQQHALKNGEKGSAGWMAVIGGQLKDYAQQREEYHYDGDTFSQRYSGAAYVPALAFPVNIVTEIYGSLSSLNLESTDFQEFGNIGLITFKLEEILRCGL